MTVSNRWCLQQILIVCYLTSTGNTVFGLGEFQTISTCSCLGYNTTYLCTAIGRGVTNWKGSAFDCEHLGNKITLTHESFHHVNGISKQCNGGEITGQSLRVEGNNYTSQLTVLVTSKLNSKTVGCEYDDLITHGEPIGQVHLNLTTEALPPPNDVHLASVQPGSLLFKWSAVANNCIPLQYEIETTCGLCPSSTDSTSVSCAVNVPHKTGVCSFTVRSVVCGNITGTWSDPVNVTMKVPEPPIITGIQASYAADGNKVLTRLLVEFRGSDEDMFNISRDINGNIHNFTIMYGDISTDFACTSVTTSNFSSSLPSSCFPSQFSNNNISVSISARNRFGEGPTTNINISGTNQYVELSTSTKTITCTFLLRGETYSKKTCKVSYGEFGKQKLWMRNQTFWDYTTATINLDLHPVLQEYHYIISATINNFTVIMSGNYSSKKGAQHKQTLITLGAITGAIMLSAVVSLTAIMAAFKIYRKYHPISYHAIFELLDRPWELLKVLQLQGINIEDTTIGGCTPRGTRRVCMRFKQHPSDEQTANLKQEIDELKSSDSTEMMESEINNCLKSVQKSKLETTDAAVCLKGSHSKYSRLLPPQPGALCSLIEGIKNLSSTSSSPYGEISITGIEGTPKRNGNTLIHLTFVCTRKLPENWKKDFDDISIC